MILKILNISRITKITYESLDSGVSDIDAYINKIIENVLKRARQSIEVKC